MSVLRKRDREETRSSIVAAALDEFAGRGFAGASTDRIAARLGTTKRMIFYYFTNKEGLYLATLEHAYGMTRSMELAIDIERLGPAEALKRVAEATFDHYTGNPNFIRLVAGENLARSTILAASDRLRAENQTVVTLVQSILRAGEASGVFRPGLSGLDVHMWISALAFFCVANSHTFGTIFAIDMTQPSFLADKRREITELVLRYVAS